MLLLDNFEFRIETFGGVSTKLIEKKTQLYQQKKAKFNCRRQSAAVSIRVLQEKENGCYITKF